VWGLLGVIVGGLAIVVFVSAVIGTVAGAGSGTSASAAPDEEQAFLSAVQDGQAVDTDNEIRLVQAQKERNAAICSVLPSKAVHNWVGTITTIDTTLGGDSGVVTVQLADDIEVGTWNNGFSDLGSHTLIDTDSPLYTQLQDINEGDTVTFSGRFIADEDDCVQEKSLADEGSMQTPTFTMKFTDISTN
jgi:hypothetical protein